MAASTFALIHGAGDVGWSWHLVADELRARGHQVVTPDLPCKDETAGLEQFVKTVVDAVGVREDLIVVGHSFGGFTAALVAERPSECRQVLAADSRAGSWETAKKLRPCGRRLRAAIDGCRSSSGPGRM